jgi:hypothetical protein
MSIPDPLDLVPPRYAFEISEVNDDRGRTYCETWVTYLDDPGTWGEFGPTVYAEDDPHRPALPLAIRRALEAGAVRVVVKPYPPHVLAPDWPECVR